MAESPSTISSTAQQTATTLYRPLSFELGQEIRLIVLYPGKREDELVCELKHANLDDKPQYEAISYTWADQSGDASLCKSITIRRFGQVAITKGADAALRRMRLQSIERTLWIDLLCIDQQNVKERQHQVALFKTIYGSANKVLVDLGKGVPTSDGIFDAAMGLVPDFPILPYDLGEFFERRWFSRLWVLQEVGLAKRAIAHCGDRSIDWILLRDFLTRPSTVQISKKQQQPLPAVLALNLDVIKTWDASEALELLLGSSRCQSADPRDKIYALLSLFKAGSGIPFVADYAKDTAILYAEVAAYIITSRKSLRILQYVRHSTSSALKLPSWVPDWSNNTQMLPAHQYLKRMYKSKAPKISIHFRDTTGLSMRPSFVLNKTSDSATPAALVVQACRLGMCWQEEDLLSGKITQQRAYDLQDPFPVWASTRRRQPLATSKFWYRIWTLGSSRRGESLRYNNFPPAFMNDFCACSDPLFSSVNIDETAVPTNVQSASPVSRRPVYNKPSLAAFMRCASTEAAAGEKKLIFATEHTLGLGPADVITGDSVWLLEGQQTSFILRPVLEGCVPKLQATNRSLGMANTCTYQLVGICYLYKALESFRFCNGCSRPVFTPSPKTWSSINIV